MTPARATAERLILALNPAAPATFRPFITHCAAAYAEGCCPLCGGPLAPPSQATADAAAAAGMLRPAGTCPACWHLFMGPDPRDPADLTGRDLAAIASMWRLALIATEPPPEEEPWTAPCGTN